MNSIEPSIEDLNELYSLVRVIRRQVADAGRSPAMLTRYVMPRYYRDRWYQRQIDDCLQGADRALMGIQKIIDYAIKERRMDE